jgi:hypothetical protein
MGLKLYFDTFLYLWLYTRFFHSDIENFSPELNLLNHEPELSSKRSVKSYITWSFASTLLTNLRLGVFKNGVNSCGS